MLALVTLLGFGICRKASLAAGSSNPIQIENAKAGTSSWQLTNPALSREIEGYASLTSVPRGGQINLFVNTSSATFTVTIYRMGWYGGLGGRQLLGPTTFTGTKQTIPTPNAQTGLVECNWINPVAVNIGFDASDPTVWCSGVYLAKLTASAGKQAYIMFVVRDDARASSVLFQSSVNTFQAYNTWGGKSLYDFQSPTGRAKKVSFNRPYALNTSTGSTPSGNGAADFLLGGDGGGFPAGWEYCGLRFLEREGDDVTYCTDVDTHENANLLLSHHTLLGVGHGEYWSWEMRATSLQRVTTASIWRFSVEYLLLAGGPRAEPGHRHPRSYRRLLQGSRRYAGRRYDRSLLPGHEFCQ